MESSQGIDKININKTNDYKQQLSMIYVVYLIVCMLVSIYVYQNHMHKWVTGIQHYAYVYSESIWSHLNTTKICDIKACDIPLLDKWYVTEHMIAPSLSSRQTSITFS